MEKGIFSLKGTTTLVTGASSGIGRRTAWLISELGGQVVITGRNEKRLGAAMERLEGEGHKAIAVELTDEGDRKKLVEECPPLNGVVHCAGVSRVAPIRYIKENVLRDIYAVNVEAPIHLTRDLVNAGQPQGGDRSCSCPRFRGYTGGLVTCPTARRKRPWPVRRGPVRRTWRLRRSGATVWPPPWCARR